MTNYIPVNLQGVSGRSYQFQVDPLHAFYHPFPGVYVFFRQDAQGYWNAIYIGETESFASRLNNVVCHHRWDSIRAAGATHIGTLHVPVGGLSAREGIETDLRHAIPTPCNLQGRGPYG